jgi:phosphoribosyl-AMP cyclohydrolase
VHVRAYCDVNQSVAWSDGDPKAARPYWCATIDRVSAPLSTGLDPLIAARLKRDATGLVPAVVQQYDTGEVLMVAWMNDAALARTLATLEATYWSRSRQALWVKGETSGHRQAVKSVALDCDGDTLLVRVDQTGPACHTGAPTCFGDVLAIAGRPAGLVATDTAALDTAVAEDAGSQEAAVEERTRGAQGR